MITFTVLIFGFVAITTQVSTYKDVKLYRAVRSPHYEGYFHGPSPLFPHLPPFIYHKDNWSGVGRGNDGSIGSVFSGATAAAANAAPNLNGAFSLAEAGATSSADCDDNSHSAGVKGSGQYASQYLQSSFQQFGSDSNSQGNLKDSTTASSQFGQNSASNGFEQQSSGGYGIQVPGFNSGHGIQSGGYRGYKGSFKESRYFVHNGRGNEFGSQESNSENSQGRSNNRVKSLSTGSNRNYEAFTQGSVKQDSSSLEANSGSSTGSEQSSFSGSNEHKTQGSSFDTNGNAEVFYHGSAQSGLGSVESNQGSFSGSGPSGSSGLKKHQYQSSFSDSAGTAEVFSHESAQPSTSFGSRDNFGASSLGQTQSGSNNLDSNQRSYSGSGYATFGSFGTYPAQHQISSGTGNFEASSEKLTKVGSKAFESYLRNEDGHAGFSGFGRHQGQDSSYGSNGKFGAISQGYAQSGSSSVNNGNSNGRGFESLKLQTGDSESLKSKQLGSASELEKSGQYEDGINGYQTSGNNGNSAVGYGQQQSTLHGALELAAQGLQAAAQAKCSTCQKSNYALSNAKSYNGAAIALSIGG